MKVKEFIEVFGKINITAECESRSCGTVYGKEEKTFNLTKAGIDNYGKRYYDVIQISRNGEIIKKYRDIYELKEDIEVMEMEIENINIDVCHHYQRSSSGNDYYDNHSEIIISVE